MPTAEECLAFRRGDEAIPHHRRRRQILEQHPEVRDLYGKNPVTFLCVAGLVAVQLGLAFLMRDQPLWVGVVAGILVGTLPALGLHFLTHEAGHHLVFRSRSLNLLTGILANSVNTLPYAILYAFHHPRHHASLSDMRADPDMPATWEARLIGRSALRKCVWLLFNPVFQAVRGTGLEAGKKPIGWLALNVALVLAMDVLVVVLLGPTALLYLFTAFFFALGLPYGALWIPEHYGKEVQQETWSYYGWLNLLLFNRGYHMEHHDFPLIPWNRLPRLRRLAPEWYDTVRSHPSYLAALLHFVFDPRVTLFSREDHTAEK